MNSIKFSRTNPPIGCYVYVYLRKNGTPYYIGKGTGGRAWDSNAHNIKPHKNLKNIVIIEWDLTDAWALIRERYYIRWFGRKDNGTGILRNLNNGGTGNCGAIPWNKGKTIWDDDDKERIGNQNRSRGPQSTETISKRVKKNIGKKRTIEQIQNLKNGRWCGENNGWKHTDKSRSKMSTARKDGLNSGKIVPHNRGLKMDAPIIDAEYWHITNTEIGMDTVIYSLRKFCESNGLKYGTLWKCAKEGRPYKGFRINKQIN